MANKNDARKLLAGAFADFLIYLTSQSNAIIVGGTYPRERVVNIFKAWASERNFDLSDADINLWREAARLGNFMKGTE